MTGSRLRALIRRRSVVAGRRRRCRSGLELGITTERLWLGDIDDALNGLHLDSAGLVGTTVTEARAVVDEVHLVVLVGGDVHDGLVAVAVAAVEGEHPARFLAMEGAAVGVGAVEEAAHLVDTTGSVVVRRVVDSSIGFFGGSIVFILCAAGWRVEECLCPSLWL